MESTQAVGTPDTSAEPSLETSLRKFNEAFNRFDAKQVAACWVENGTLISPMGEIGRGRSGVETTYRHDCESVLQGTTSRFSIQSVRRLGGDLALLDLDHELQNARLPSGSRGTLKLHVVMLAQRSGSGWQWVDARPYLFASPPPSVH
ncbi:YybH family protein [Anaeromyxobacter dehalogenans]|uniref:DUF4440 domain-containing protein n=1 Tax=Anaeromyxobacter dehalogenans (strain 2CP-C) TaxID=290397 RepID=Q2IGC9_ANADE|nr:nuclear transport factor 2 family protein [Anaeromyxobacter dehalogenans]ABC83637.1 hypothetical protein Adeh_3872 [Anaeromyxobacter dehalogenans 2CP-C]